jgi:hypothetical protein
MRTTQMGPGRVRQNLFCWISTTKALSWWTSYTDVCAVYEGHIVLEYTYIIGY